MTLAQFIDLIRAGDVEGVRRAVRDDPRLVDSHDPNSFGATPLGHAVGCDDREVAAALLDAGADIDATSDWWAGGFGVLDSATDAMSEWLLERGATLTPHAAARLGRIDDLRRMLDERPELVHARGGDGQRPLHFARTAAIAELLLDCGAEIDALDVDHASTAAQWQATRRRDVARWLVGRGARLDPALAALIGDVRRLEELVGATAEGVAWRINRTTCPAAPPAAGHIYLYTVGEGCTLMHAAAIADEPEVIRWLAKAGADPNALGGYDDGAPLHQAAWNDSARAAKALLDVGADREQSSGPTHRNEPIGWAIVGGSKEVVRLLLDHGCRLRPAHLDDARDGARGRFRCFHRERPLEAWTEIARMVMEAAREGG